MTDDLFSISLRLPKDIIERADALAPFFRESNEELPLWGGKVTRAGILRLAMLQGIKHYEGLFQGLMAPSEENLNKET
tara:strand:+ start:292 stop:525 length:234 start_codon:yes stop_codon:yes gene_type:complete